MSSYHGFFLLLELSYWRVSLLFKLSFHSKSFGSSGWSSTFQFQTSICRPHLFWRLWLTLKSFDTRVQFSSPSRPNSSDVINLEVMLTSKSDIIINLGFRSKWWSANGPIMRSVCGIILHSLEFKHSHLESKQRQGWILLAPFSNLFHSEHQVSLPSRVHLVQHLLTLHVQLCLYSFFNGICANCHETNLPPNPE